MAHFRPVVSFENVGDNIKSDLTFHPTSSLKSFIKEHSSKNTKVDIPSKGGFTVTFLKKSKDKNKYIVSLASCSSKDVFSRSEGRFQSLLNYIQNKKNSVYQMTVNEGEDVFEKFTTTLKNTVMPNLK